MLGSLKNILKDTGHNLSDNVSKSFDPDRRADINEYGNDVRLDNLKFDPDRRIDAENFKLDDNGRPYRFDDNLIPNNHYELNGYKYETDNKGRIISAEGDLQLKETSGYSSIKNDITLNKLGKGNELLTDDRGHLIGNQFKGAGDVGNLTAQDASLNRGDIKSLENTLAGEIRSGKDVYLKIDVDYEKNSHRPSSYTYTYSIDGEMGMKTFLNRGKE